MPGRLTVTGRPRVLLVGHAVHDRGGMERACAELVRRAHDRFDFTVVSVDLAPPLLAYCQWSRIRVPRRPMPLRFVSFFLITGIRVARLEADIVHTVGAIIPNDVDIASVHFCHAGYRAAGNRRSYQEMGFGRWISLSLGQRLALVVERYCYRPQRVRMLGAVSGGVAAELRREYEHVPVAWTPNGVDIERYRPDPRRRRELRTSVGAEENDLVALFVGGDWAHKGLAIAIQALRLAAEAGVDFSLWVLGSGRAAQLQALADRHSVGSRVRYFGMRGDTELFYAAADVFVLPSAYETFSLVAYEAAASGLPVVATAVSGITELVGADQAGMVVPRTAAAVAQALVTLGLDPELRQRLGAEGRRRAAAYTWDRAVAAVTELYNELLAGKGGRQPSAAGA